MFKIPGFPERPHYNSVEAYLKELAKDIAEITVDPIKMGRFKEQLKIYAKSWQKWKTFEDADQKGCWKPEMGRPECIYNIFSRTYNFLNDTEKEDKGLAGSYALCAMIHDSQLPHLDKINTDIIPVEAIEETLSAPRNTLEGRTVGPCNSGPDVREIYLIEEFFNRVSIDLQEFCKSDENKIKQKFIEGQIHQASELSDVEFLKIVMEKFKERAKNVLSKDANWHDLDRSLKGWFDAAIERVKNQGFTDDTIGLLNYFYSNLLYYTRSITIKSFRGFSDPIIVNYAKKYATELAEKFNELARRDKDTLVPNNHKNESDVIVELLRKDYLLKTENVLKQKTAAISQDFINRGLSNSTAFVNKQVEARFEYINELVNYITKSIEKDFAYIPLNDVKERLFYIVEEYYKKIIPFANSYLVNAGLAQTNILKSFENQINNKKETAKQIIETKVALSDKQRPKSEEQLVGKGDTYINAKHVSIGNNAQHASKDINNTSELENKKPWYKKAWTWIVGLLTFLSLVVAITGRSLPDWFFKATNNTLTPTPNVNMSSVSAPVELNIADIPPQIVSVGQKASFDVIVSGAPEENIICVVNYLPEYAIFNKNHFEWTPRKGQIGPYQLEIIAKYDDIQKKKYTMVFVSKNTNPNTPSMNTWENNIAKEGEQVSINLSSFYPDNKKIEFRVYNLPVGAIFYDKSLIWVPDLGQAGKYEIKVDIIDGNDVTTRKLSININPNKEPDYATKRSIYYWKTTLSLFEK